MPAPCASNAYLKSDGKYYCTFTIKDTLTWYQANDACKRKGGILPEIYNATDVFNIVMQKVAWKICSDMQKNSFLMANLQAPYKYLSDPKLSF